MPYTNRNCDDFAIRLKQVVSSNFPQVEFNVAFQPPTTIGSFFSFKDRIKSNLEKSMVVYRIKCAKPKCKATYIGKTERILLHRIHEHRGPLHTRKTFDEILKDPTTTACHKHTLTTNHPMDYDNVEVLDHADTFTKLSVKELLHILKKKPSLNKQLNSQSSFEIKTLIVKEYPHFAEKNKKKQQQAA